MGEAILSVVIPIFNKSAYIKKCLDSIVGQSLDDIEIICVDDASTDDSLDIVREYAASDNRIIVIENDTNIGAALSRNEGLEHATGKYVIFLDADDFFSKDLFEITIQTADELQAEIVFFDFAEVKDQLRDIIFHEQKWWIINAVQANRGILPRELYPWFFLTNSPATWNKLYLRSFVERIGARFQNISSSNDVFFSNYCMLMSDKIAYAPSIEPLLYYRTNVENQIVGKLDQDPLAVFKALDETYRIINEIPCVQELNISFIDRAPLNLIYAYMKLRTDKGRTEFTKYALSDGGIRKYGLWNVSRRDFLSDEGYKTYLQLLEELGCVDERQSTIDRSEEQFWFDDAFFDQLNELGLRIAVWGYGKYGKHFCEQSIRCGCHVYGILDNGTESSDEIVNRFEDFDWNSIDAVIIMIRDKHMNLEGATKEVRAYKPDCAVLDAMLWLEWRLPLKYCFC